ncbi:MAG TPA: hypothetical protein EYH22_02640 [Candidatus Nanopusillus sp.]|nr:hypothetical protein [Candidatus Nanopusillus sp.]
MDIIDRLSQYIPIVKGPSHPLSFNERLKHTLIVLVLYFVLATIPLWGISTEISERLRELAWIFGSSFGTLVTLGIGPIVMAGIFLQLLVGGEIININLQSEEGRMKFDNYQRFLTFVFILIEALVILISGTLKPDFSLGVPPLLMYLIIFLQLVIGGIIIVLLDDYALKYAITAGVNLFILASISRALMIRLLNPFPPTEGQTPTGLFFVGIHLLLQGNLNEAIGVFLIIATTISILILAAYLQATRVEVPLLMARIGGKIMKFPIRVLYTSVIPIILLFAILIQIENIYMWITGSNQIPWILTRPNLIYNLSIYGLSYLLDLKNILHIIVYFLIYIIGAPILSYLWVISAGMDARTIAQQLAASPMIQLSMRDPRILERALEKYIRSISILSGILIGFLASIADILGSALAGTSLLLLVVIAYSIYEDFVRNNVAHLLPIIGKLLAKR